MQDIPEVLQHEDEAAIPERSQLHGYPKVAGAERSRTVSIDSEASTEVDDHAEDTAKSTDEIKQESQVKPKGRTWLSARNGTKLGLAALAFSFLQIFVSFAILQASNGTPVRDWKFQPNVYLAILTAISNEALTFAAVQGTVVSWWLKSRRGTTLAQLYHDYDNGLNVWGALSSGKRFNALALSCLCATFVNIDGPLLQRASTVASRISTQPASLTVSIAPEIPSYFTGWTLFDGFAQGANPGSDFMPVVRAFENSEAITSGISGCNGICNATVRAPALILDRCVTTSQSVNFSAPLSKKQLDIARKYNTSPGNRILFEIEFWSVNGTKEGLDIVLGLPDDAVIKKCTGNIEWHTCVYASAVAEYPVTIDHGKITFRESTAYPRLVALANNTAITDESIAHFGLNQEGTRWVRSTLGGITAVANYMYSTVQGLIPSRTPGDTPELAGPFTWPVFQHITNWDAWNNLQDCAPAFSDPREQILASLNEIMFRTGVYVAQNYDEMWLKDRMDDGLESHYNVTGTPLTPVNFFEADLTYFFAAAVVEVLTVVAILYTFYGWWRLDRTPTFNPLEIAKAFDAPLLHPAGVYDRADEIADSVGATPVQYRFVEDDDDLVRRRQAFNSFDPA